MNPSPDKPTTLTAFNSAELFDLLARAGNGEFKTLTLEYGHGRPGKCFCTLGVIWPTEQQENLL